jgi:hypothetical protein
MMSALSAADTAKKTLTGLVEAVNSLQRSAKAFESILERIDTVVSEIEKPAKVLGPEMERLATRMTAMGDVFDRVSIDQFPDLVEQLMGQLSGVVGGLADLPKRLGPLGDLLGGATAFMGLGRSSRSVPVLEPSAPPRKPATKKPAVTSKAVTKKAVTKKAAAKKAPTKKTPIKTRKR